MNRKNIALCELLIYALWVGSVGMIFAGIFCHMSILLLIGVCLLFVMDRASAIFNKYRQELEQRQGEYQALNNVENGVVVN